MSHNLRVVTEPDKAVQLVKIFEDAKQQALALLETARPKEPHFLTAKDVAKILQVSKERVYEMRRDGRLPADVDFKDAKDRYRWYPETVYSFAAVE